MISSHIALQGYFFATFFGFFLLSIFRAFVDFKVEVIVMAHISLFFIVQTFDLVVVVVTMAEKY